MRKWIVTVVFVLILCTAAGCAQMPAELTVDESMTAIMENVAFEDTLEEIDRDVITWRYGVGDDIEARVFVGSGATAEEACVMKAPDSQTAAELLAGLEQYLQDTRDSFENYQPKEVRKIDGAFLKQYNSTVVLVISADDDAEEKLTHFFK